MSLEELNTKLESSHFYQFTQRHKKVINIIQGFVIIGLLISMNMYVYYDHQLKKQIADHCGYVTSKYKCICEEHYAENWEEMQNGNFQINLSNVVNVST